MAKTIEQIVREKKRAPGEVRAHSGGRDPSTREDRVMSNLNSDQFGGSCSTCGNEPGTDGEIGGRGARGCPTCGATLSPVVSVQRVPETPLSHGLSTVGRVTNNGQPIRGSDGRVETGSVVMRREDGSHVASIVDWDQERYEASAKSPRAAALAAHHKLAEAHGKVFRPRTATERKQINETAKNLGYGSDWSKY